MLERRLPDLVLAGGLLGAVLLALAQFLPLFHTYVSPGRSAIDTVLAGSEHGWAILPIAALAAALAIVVRTTGSRPALIAVGVLAIAALAITLTIDLPAAHRSGLASVAGNDVPAGDTPAAGLYVEVAGGLVLLLSCTAGFLLAAPPPAALARRVPRRPRGDGPRPQGDGAERVSRS